MVRKHGRYFSSYDVAEGEAILRKDDYSSVLKLNSREIRAISKRKSCLHKEIRIRPSQLVSQEEPTPYLNSKTGSKKRSTRLSREGVRSN